MVELTEIEYNELRQLEEELWRVETRSNRRRMLDIIADDFMEFGRSGRVYSRDEVLAIDTSSLNAVLPLSNFKVRLIAPDVVQITYNSEVRLGTSILRARRSSIWTRTKTGWQLRFHQGTPYDEDRL
jgi:hypothetical protein